MNTYYELIKHLKTIYEQDIDVNTVVTGDANDVDNYKKNIFPLVHLHIIDSPFISEATTALTRYNVEVTCVDIRDINKEAVNDKFWMNDNRHDNLNLTRAILKKAENKFIKNILNTDITLITSTSAIPLMFAKQNTLDGWQQTLTMDVPDLLTTVC